MKTAKDRAGGLAKSRRRIEVQPLAGSIGAEIIGVDLGGELDDDTIAAIRQALLEYIVIFFRDQETTPERRVAFGRRFGELYRYPDYRAGEARFDTHADYPEIIELRKEPEDRRNIGNRWHSDVTFHECPPMGSILYALEVPAVGGDTLFANQYLAFETLSPGMRAMLKELRAIHDDAHVVHPDLDPTALLEGRAAVPPDSTRPLTATSHPVVRTHPETGRQALFVNRSYTRRFDEMTVAESRGLLEYLFTQATRSDLICRFRWKPGSVAFWDNRCLKHYASNDYHGLRRVMHRVTIVGDRPV